MIRIQPKFLVQRQIVIGLRFIAKPFFDLFRREIIPVEQLPIGVLLEGRLHCLAYLCLAMVHRSFLNLSRLEPLPCTRQILSTLSETMPAAADGETVYTPDLSRHAG